MIKTGHAALVIALIGLGGLGVAFQGWRARGPDVDVVSAMVRAVALVERGHIPRRGNLTDNNSFRPPGSTWLAIPGLFMFSDPRLVELAGSGLLYLATLPGVFLIGRHFFSVNVGLFATLIYSVSAIAITHASLQQPRAHPVFCVWMVYCAALWVARRDARWLAAAGLVWAAGMYSHMEMAPWFLILPALWWHHRPPIEVRPLVVAAILAVIMWSPYLAFQWDRDFVDLQSQLLLRRIDSRGVETVPWCGEDPYPQPQFRAMPVLNAGLLQERVVSIADMTLVNLESRVLGGQFVLLVLLVGGLVTAVAREDTTRSWSLPSSRPTVAWLTAIATISILTSEFGQRWLVHAASPIEQLLLNVRRLHVWALLAAGVVLVRDPQFARCAGALRQSWCRGDEARVLATAIVIPSVVLLVLSDSGQSRMLGIWPLQVTLIAGMVGAVLTTSRATRRSWLPGLLVVMVVAANLPVLQRVRDWQAHGWSGVEPAHVEAADFRAVRCEDER